MLAIVLFGCFAVAWSAPVEQGAIAPLELKPFHQLREFLILTPEAQLQLQPAFKLQQPVIQPLALYGPSSTRQTAADICNQITNNFPSFNFPFPLPFPSADGQGDDGSSDDGGEKLANPQKQQLPEINTEAENIPAGMIPQTPASTIPLPERRFYTIAGRPQFFGNVDILRNPLHPIFSLQPLQAIKARSVANPIAEIGQNDKNAIQTLPVVESLPLAQPLRINEDIPQESLQSNDAARNFAQMLNARQIILAPSAQDIVAQQFAQRFSDDRVSKLDQEALPLVIAQNPSIAHAKPVAVAVTGKGGTAQAGPISTAIAGKQGLAVASPSATSVAGFVQPQKPSEDGQKEPSPAEPAN